jgi:hypothetical protein
MPATWPTWVLSEALTWPLSRAFRLINWLEDVVEPVELLWVASGVPVVAAGVVAMVAWLVAAAVADVVAEGVVAMVASPVADMVAAEVAKGVVAIVASPVADIVPAGVPVLVAVPPPQAARNNAMVNKTGTTNFLIAD